MSDVHATKIEEILPYEGPAGTIPGIRFRPAGRALGVHAWGMNILAIDAACTGYPEHDHTKDGQEEVYVVLEGDGTLEAGEETVTLEPGVLVRVGPATRRKILPGSRGVVVLVIGGTPGSAYTKGPTRAK